MERYTLEGLSMDDGVSPSSVAEATRIAMQLPLAERAELAHLLLVSLDDASPAELEQLETREANIEQLWIEEAERRLDDYRQGRSRGIPAEDVFSRARAKLRE